MTESNNLNWVIVGVTLPVAAAIFAAATGWVTPKVNSIENSNENDPSVSQDMLLNGTSNFKVEMLAQQIGYLENVTKKLKKETHKTLSIVDNKKQQLKEIKRTRNSTVAPSNPTPPQAPQAPQAPQPAPPTHSSTGASG